MQRLSLSILFATSAVIASCDKASETTSGIDLDLGKTVYTQRCGSCHERGMAGAPRTGMAGEWTTALARGIDTLIANSIEGYRGERGFMPPRGGHAALTDAEVTAAVHYMISNIR